MNKEQECVLTCPCCKAKFSYWKPDWNDANGNLHQECFHDLLCSRCYDAALTICEDTGICGGDLEDDDGNKLCIDHCLAMHNFDLYNAIKDINR